jgi:hypothetical protein
MRADTSAELEGFLERWQGEFTKFRGQYWEGPAAHQELKRSGLLPRVLCEEKSDQGAGRDHPVAEHAIEAVCAELHHYQNRVGKIRETIELEKTYDGMLEGLARDLHAAVDRCRSQSPEHSKRLAQFVKVVKNEQRDLRYDQKQRWRFPRSVSVESVFNRRVPIQERELDSWFQIRLGILFRTYLPVEMGLSLETIARLVVLFLFCAKIALLQDGTILKLAHNEEEVSVRNVLRKLRQTNIDRLRKGKRKSSQTGKQ